jgi:dTDP-4-amino-4,6-dideoxygalactose transaminase
MIIPFTNLAAEYDGIQNELDGAIQATIRSFQFGRGSTVTKFENAFAGMLGMRYCIGTGNGTDSLFSILKAFGVQAGDEVITPSWSWISTAEIISLCGATPVFADVDIKTYTIDPNEIEKAITPKTKCVIAVHLYGHVAAMEVIARICREKGLMLIEDCAQAHLSHLDGKYAGTFGHAAAFSFYPTKNLGAYGDAGCVITNDASLDEWIRRFNNHGALIKDDHLFAGSNSRMDQIQAAILLAKLPYLRKRNDLRVRNALRYAALLCDEKNITIPASSAGDGHTYHIYAIRAKNRDGLKKYLEENGISTIVHYPSALTNLPPYKGGVNADAFPVSGRLEREILSLPIYPELTDDQIAYVCEKIKAFYLK